MPLTPEQSLAAAWTHCAPQRAGDVPFPQGFWPDVARVAMAIFEQQTVTPSLDFRPTQCLVGNSPAPTQSRGKASAGKKSAAEKAANTARLLAAMGAVK